MGKGFKEYKKEIILGVLLTILIGSFNSIVKNAELRLKNDISLSTGNQIRALESKIDDESSKRRKLILELVSQGIKINEELIAEANTTNKSYDSQITSVSIETQFTGDNKVYASTNLAREALRFKIDFTITSASKQILDEDLYLRIIGPSGIISNNGINSIQINDEVLFYSKKVELRVNKDKSHQTLYLDLRNSIISSGKYELSILNSNSEILSTTYFKLL